MMARADSPAFGLNDSIYNRLLRERIIWLGSEVRDENANAICAQMMLLAAEDPDKDIWLYINSPGGSITAGMAIYDTMQYIQPDVATIAMGMAASMGQFLLSSGAKGKRYATAARPRDDAPALGRHRRHRDRRADQRPADPAHEERARRAHRRADRARPSSRSTRDADRDRWFTAPEALEYGFVDHVVDEGRLGRRRRRHGTDGLGAP